MEKGERLVYIGEDKLDIKKGDKVKLLSFWHIPKYLDDVHLSVGREINNQIVRVRVVLPQKLYRTISDYRNQRIDQILS